MPPEGWVEQTVTMAHLPRGLNVKRILIPRAKSGLTSISFDSHYARITLNLNYSRRESPAPPKTTFPEFVAGLNLPTRPHEFRDAFIGMMKHWYGPRTQFSGSIEKQGEANFQKFCTENKLSLNLLDGQPAFAADQLDQAYGKATNRSTFFAIANDQWPMLSQMGWLAEQVFGQRDAELLLLDAMKFRLSKNHWPTSLPKGSGTFNLDTASQFCRISRKVSGPGPTTQTHQPPSPIIQNTREEPKTATQVIAAYPPLIDEFDETLNSK